MQITGLHHVTAITADAPGNLAFYTQVLGLRLVKKTVNQDDVSAYHLFYGDRIGSAGTEVTFFDWPQTPRNRNGAGSISRISLRVASRGALSWWAQRLAAAGVTQEGLVEVGGRTVLRFTDPEGQELELASDEGAPGGTPWERSPVPAEMGIRGLNAVHLLVPDLAPLARVLTGVMGFERVDETEDTSEPGRRVAVFATAGGGPGTEVHVGYGPNLPPARQGYGGVHHVAFARLTGKNSANGARKSLPPDCRSPMSSTATISNRSTSGCRAGCCSRSPPMGPVLPPMKTPSIWARRWRCRRFSNRTGLESKPACVRWR